MLSIIESLFVLHQISMKLVDTQRYALPQSIFEFILLY